MERKVFITNSNLNQISNFGKTDENYDYNGKNILFLGKKNLIRLNKYNEVLHKLKNNKKIDLFHINKKDTYTKVYEGLSPAYHAHKNCKNLDKSFIGIGIPQIIRGFNSKNKEKIEEYREWYKKTFSLIEKYREDIDYIASLERKKLLFEKNLRKFKKKWLEQENFKEKFEKRWNENFNEDDLDFQICGNSGYNGFVDFDIDKNIEELDFLISDRKNFLDSLSYIEKYIIELYGLDFYYIKKIYNKENKTKYLDYLGENFIKTDFLDFYDLKEYGFDKVYNLLDFYDKNFIKKVYEGLFIHINLVNGNIDNLFGETLLEQLGFKRCSECFKDIKNNIEEDNNENFIDLRDIYRKKLEKFQK